MHLMQRRQSLAEGTMQCGNQLHWERDSVWSTREPVVPVPRQRLLLVHSRAHARCVPPVPQQQVPSQRRVPRRLPARVDPFWRGRLQEKVHVPTCVPKWRHGPDSQRSLCTQRHRNSRVPVPGPQLLPLRPTGGRVWGHLPEMPRRKVPVERDVPGRLLNRASWVYRVLPRQLRSGVPPSFRLHQQS